MPRGEHFQKASDDELRQAINREEFVGELFGPDDVATVLNREILDDSTISREAVRQRLMKLDAVEHTKIGRDVFFRRRGDEIDPNALFGTTPAGAATEGARRGWRAYPTRAMSWVMNERVERSRAWFDDPETEFPAEPLAPLALSFVRAAVVAAVATIIITGSVVQAGYIGLLSGLLGTVFSGVAGLLLTRSRNLGGDA